MTDTPAGAWPQPETEVEVSASPELQLTVDQKNGLIREWIDQKNRCSDATKIEKSARENMVTALFPSPKKGTQRYISPEGFGSIKLVHGWNYSLGDKDKVDLVSGLKVEIATQVDQTLNCIEQLGERGKAIAERIVKWKPELSVSVYDELCASTDPTDARAKELIDEILTVKPASPQVEFEPPKNKG